jgi:hypothetical protein
MPGALHTWSDTQLLAKGTWPESDTYITVAAVESTREELCVILRGAAAQRWADGRFEARTLDVRGRTAILHPDPTSGSDAASLLLWIEDDELMIQLLAEHATVDELLHVAEGLEVEITPGP